MTKMIGGAANAYDIETKAKYALRQTDRFSLFIERRNIQLQIQLHSKYKNMKTKYLKGDCEVTD